MTPPTAFPEKTKNNDGFVRHREIKTTVKKNNNLSSKSYLIKVCNDLIEQSETLNSLVIDLLLLVVFIKASDGGKHYPHLIIGLRIQLLDKDNIKFGPLFGLFSL